MRSEARGVVLGVVCNESDALRFGRRMSADVNQSPLSLTRVMVMGRQVYPTHDSVLGNPDTLMRCEFRVRNVSAVIANEHIRDLFRRLEGYEVIEAHTIDSGGVVLDRVSVPMRVGA